VLAAPVRTILWLAGVAAYVPIGSAGPVPPGDARGRPALVPAAEVNRLASAEANARRPVRLAGMVVHSDADWQLLFVVDSSGATFIDPVGLPTLPSPGTRVEVEGEAGSVGGFPGVVPVRLVETGQGELPAAWRPRRLASA
jgi:hypothetical protein